MAKQILIVGDSFASEHLSGCIGWPSLLAKEYTVTNMALPGIGEYKILSLLKSQKLDHFEFIIISHTSPYRVHTEINPLYAENHTYRASDLIFADVENKIDHDEVARSLFVYFQKVFDPTYYEWIHTKCCEEIHGLEQKTCAKFIHITHFEWKRLYQFPNLVNFYNLWTLNKGPFAHYNENGNHVVYQHLKSQMING